MGQWALKQPLKWAGRLSAGQLATSGGQPCSVQPATWPAVPAKGQFKGDFGGFRAREIGEILWGFLAGFPRILSKEFSVQFTLNTTQTSHAFHTNIYQE